MEIYNRFRHNFKGDRVEIDIKKFHSMHGPKRFPGTELIKYKNKYRNSWGKHVYYS